LISSLLDETRLEQQWQFIPKEKTFFEIKSVANGFFIGIENGDSSRGAKVVVSPQNHSNSQKFNVRCADIYNLCFFIEPQHSGLLLDVNKEDQLIQFRSIGASNQLFTFIPAPVIPAKMEIDPISQLVSSYTYSSSREIESKENESQIGSKEVNSRDIPDEEISNGINSRDIPNEEISKEDHSRENSKDADSQEISHEALSREIPHENTIESHSREIPNENTIESHSREIHSQNTSRESETPTQTGGRQELDQLCVVCMENPKEMAYDPCGHICACSVCTDKIIGKNGQCPMCKTTITKTLKIFFA